MLRRHLFAFALLCSFTTALHAQDVDLLARVGWEQLPESFYLDWKLDPDVSKRLGVIEEDYNAERAIVVSDSLATQTQRDDRLRQLAVARRQEIKGILTTEQYEDWQNRAGATGSGGH